MNRAWRWRDLFSVGAQALLIVAKPLLIVLALHLLASYFHWQLFREAGGSVVSQVSQRTAGAPPART
jgi:hypothetical protein